MESERDIKAKIRNLLRKVPGCKFFPYNPMYGENGIPDIVGMKKVLITPNMVGETLGVFMAFEVKTKKGVLTKLQQGQIRAIMDAGGFAFVVRSRQDVVDILTQFEENQNG